jgi:hypothetical protein
MRKVIAIIAIVVCNVISIQSQQLIDTSEKYKTHRKKRKAKNDCTVRAVSEAFNVSYSKAFNQMKRFGRHKARGMNKKHFINAIQKYYLDEVVTAGIFDEPTFPFYFTLNLAEDGYTYLVMNNYHIFVIEQNEDREWTVYGNKEDLYTDITMFIKLKVNN